MKRKNIFKYYLKYVRPNNAELAVVGKYSDTIVSDLNKHFANWKVRKTRPIVYPKVEGIEGTKILLVDAPKLNQAHIIVGQKGVYRKTKDFIALKVLNTILGGAYTSRLMSDVRAKKGLTYSIGSSFLSQKEAGVFRVKTFTRTDKVGETLKAIFQNLKILKEKGVTEAELQRAKSYLKGSFPRQLQTPESLAKTQMLLKHYGVEEDYLEDYLADLEDISMEDMERVIKKYLTDKNFKVLVYGSRKKVISQLRPLGVVTVKSYRSYL